MSPDTHAILSASASHRWLHCTAAPRFEAQFPADESSPYANEGRVAHELAYIYGQREFMAGEYDKAIEEIKRSPYYTEDMPGYVDVYIQYIKEEAFKFKHFPHIAQEIRVEYSAYVPEGFGTCDCVMIGDDILHIVDFKYGKGVKVSAQNNSQMRLYALGALGRYAPFYDVKRVVTSIVQPRISEDVDSEEMTVEEVLEWGESIKPIAEKAYAGMGSYEPGEWCRFCRGKAHCKARAEKYLTLDTRDPNMMTPAEIGEALSRGEDIAEWINALKDAANAAILSGQNIPGWKVVAGRSLRAFDDTDAAFKILTDSGVNEAMLYDRKPKSLAELEKMLGKTKFNELVGDHIRKPYGKPTLVPASDKREPYQSSIADFAPLENT